MIEGNVWNEDGSRPDADTSFFYMEQTVNDMHEVDLDHIELVVQSQQIEWRQVHLSESDD
jgi:hypothetical protein